MKNSITTNATSAVMPYTAILPDGYVHAVTYEQNAYPATANHDHEYGDCPICGRNALIDGVRVINHAIDSKHERCYHANCLALDAHARRDLRAIVDGKPVKIADGITVVCEFMPHNGHDSKELAAALLTPIRNSETETVGRWFRLSNCGGYSSVQTRNLKWHSRLATAAKLCEAADVALHIYVRGVFVETLNFTWSNRDERGKFISADKRYKHGFLVASDWAVGKYRRHGKGYYYYPENIERAKIERAGMNWCYLFK